jgi:integrase
MIFRSYAVSYRLIESQLKWGYIWGYFHATEATAPVPLTNLKLKSLRPAAKPYKVADEKGLYLLVTPTGSMRWRYKFRFAGKEKLLSIGVFPEVSLKAARDRRDDARLALRDGKDPSTVKRQEKAGQRAAAENSFEAVARRWHESKAKGAKWSPGHAEHVLREMERNLFPSIGKLPVRDIDPATLLACIHRIEKRGALDVASRALQRARSVFKYAMQTALIELNPAAPLEGVLTPRPLVHQPALSVKELGPFLARLNGFERIKTSTRLALRLQVLTFVRPGELRGARWEEFDLEAKLWHIPAHRMKGGRRAHNVPLSGQALDVLRELQGHSGTSVYLFPSDRTPAKPMSENALSYAMGRMGYKGTATAHGFRSTASTTLNEVGTFRSDVIERQLAHIEPNQVRDAYNHAEYLPERIVMMNWWGDFVADLERNA